MRRLIWLILVPMIMFSGCQSQVNSSATHGELRLSLPENPSTGYRWSCELLPGGVVEISSDVFEPAPTGLVGASGNRIWIFRHIQAGDAYLILTYYRPWEGMAQAVEQRIIHITAEPGGSLTQTEMPPLAVESDIKRYTTFMSSHQGIMVKPSWMFPAGLVEYRWSVSEGGFFNRISYELKRTQSGEDALWGPDLDQTPVDMDIHLVMEICDAITQQILISRDLTIHGSATGWFEID